MIPGGMSDEVIPEEDVPWDWHREDRHDDADTAGQVVVTGMGDGKNGTTVPDHLPECYAYQVEYLMGFACICEQLRACEKRVWGDADFVVSETYRNALQEAVKAINAYADETHQHVGMDKCWPENGDRCDITAALRVAVNRVEILIETIDQEIQI